MPDIVALPLDLSQHGQPAAGEQVDFDSYVRRYEVDERQALVEQVARALDLEAHQFDERTIESAGGQVAVRISEPPAIFFGQVDPTDREIAGHVLPEIGQLQSRANAVG